MALSSSIPVPGPCRPTSTRSRSSRASPPRSHRSAQALRESLPPEVACQVLRPGTMATHTKHPSEAWTVPLHIVMWTTLTVGFIMVLVVFMLH